MLYVSAYVNVPIWHSRQAVIPTNNFFIKKILKFYWIEKQKPIIKRKIWPEKQRELQN